MEKRNGKSMATEPKEVKTRAQRALEAKAKYQQLLEDGKNELLETANQAIKDLAELGFSYRLLSEEEYQSLTVRPAVSAPVPRRAPKSDGTGKTSSDRPPKPDGPGPANGEWKYCPQHGWGDHDGRKHRLETIAAKKAEATQAPAATA